MYNRAFKFVVSGVSHSLVGLFSTTKTHKIGYVIKRFFFTLSLCFATRNKHSLTTVAFGYNQWIATQLCTVYYTSVM
jgi:hypothetical protein